MTDLSADIERFLRTGQGDFDALALALFAYQVERNAPYRSYGEALDKTPATVKQWSDIPAVPVGAFKSSELCTFPSARAAAIFESSATTTGQPSRHFIKDLRFYEQSLKTSFAKWVLPDAKPVPMLLLVPSPGEAPRSSLTWMLEVVQRQWGAPGSQYLIKRGRLDELWLATLLSKSESSGEPVALLGTTIAFMALFDYARAEQKAWSLPAGSRLMDTGGMKTRQRGITRVQFVDDVQAFLGIPEALCINEYGMCEMGSQFYGRGASSIVEAPPWVKSMAVDGVTGERLPEGRPGLLRHVDLANVDSVLALQTEDIGVVQGSQIELRGRASGADLKGCSIAAERFFQTSRR